jgi:hypothetical protein
MKYLSSILYKFIGFVVTILIIQSCIIVVHENKKIEYDPEITLSPKPILKMSDVLIRSDKGDMIAFLPVNWFLIDVESRINKDVIAVAVNPDYTLSAVFSHIRSNEIIEETFSKEGLYGLARVSLERRENKTLGSVKQLGRYQTINMGNQEFVKYEYSITGGALMARSAVFASSTSDFYEISIIPINVKNNIQPNSREIDELFQSFLASIKY